VNAVVISSYRLRIRSLELQLKANARYWSDVERNWNHMADDYEAAIGELCWFAVQAQTKPNRVSPQVRGVLKTTLSLPMVQRSLKRQEQTP
jgi:hypothetical protein